MKHSECKRLQLCLNCCTLSHWCSDWSSGTLRQESVPHGQHCEHYTTVWWFVAAACLDKS